MKALVFLLVLANLLFYAFSAGLFGRPDNPDAGRVEQQVAPDRMRIVSRGEAPAAPAPVPSAAPVAAPLESAESVGNLCLLWENLAPADADRLGTLLTDKFVDFHVERRNLAREGSGWWVYIPPLASKAEADKKVAQLRGLGVNDFFVVQEQRNRFAISLGIFSSEKGGADRLADLKAKGVKSARLSPRPGAESTVALQVSGPPAAKAALLGATAEVLPGVEPQVCK